MNYQIYHDCKTTKVPIIVIFECHEIAHIGCVKCQSCEKVYHTYQDDLRE